MPKRKPKPIGEQLREAREARGLKQYQVAAAAGIDQSLLSKFERGVPGRKLSVEQAYKLARVLAGRFVTDKRGTILELEE